MRQANSQIPQAGETHIVEGPTGTFTFYSPGEYAALEASRTVNADRIVSKDDFLRGIPFAVKQAAITEMMSNPTLNVSWQLLNASPELHVDEMPFRTGCAVFTKAGFFNGDIIAAAIGDTPEAVNAWLIPAVGALPA